MIEKIEKGINEIKNIKMTENEKDYMMARILEHREPIKEKIKTPYFFKISIPNKYFAYSLALLFLVILISGGALVNFSSKEKNGNLSYAPTSLENENYSRKDLSGKELAKLDQSKKTIEESISKDPTKTEKNSPTLKNPAINNQMPATGTSLMSVTSENYENKNYENIAERAFGEWLNKISTEEAEVLEYKINKITFIAQKTTEKEPEKYWFTPKDTNDAFMVKINFSIQTDINGKYYWLAGNGEEGENDWILNKEMFFTIDKESNTFVITRAGTGP